uniref:hypothetical protein n=1 Tax=Mycobacterium avium TaxID=1764 RepID=UPI000A6D82F0
MSDYGTLSEFVSATSSLFGIALAGDYSLYLLTHFGVELGRRRQPAAVSVPHYRPHEAVLDAAARPQLEQDIAPAEKQELPVIPIV